MTSIKCSACGLINWSSDLHCRRCAHDLNELQVATVSHTDDLHDEEEDGQPPRTVLRRVMGTLGLTVLALLMSYWSLLTTSDPVTLAQRQIVQQAIDVLRERGFTSEARMLGFVNFRATDHWWNHWLGHGDAYAATNFPFQIVTLYPRFFDVPIDDTERAAILLHESYHLFGKDEHDAYTNGWRARHKLQWTSEAYGGTRVWKNVRESTLLHAPEVVRCGANDQTDCTEQSASTQN